MLFIWILNLILKLKYCEAEVTDYWADNYDPGMVTLPYISNICNNRE